MQQKEQTIEKLVIRVETYAKTNLELIKLQTVDKTADITSKLISRILLLISFSFFALFINLGLAFLIGEFCGKLFYGFAIIAGFYLLLSILLFFAHRAIIFKLKNHFIKLLLH